MRMRVHSKTALLAVATVITFAGVARAQRVTGVVRDSASRQPVPSAVVRLFDATGRELERTVTNRDGRYRLDALPTAHQLRVLRIGFRPRTMPFAFSASARDTTLDITLVTLPTLLDAVEVSDQPQCSRRSDRAAALALWEQARAALLATVVARESQAPLIAAIVYDRTLDRRGRIVRQRVRHDSLPTNRPFIAARPVAEFRDQGYAEGATTQRTYFAPDADVLLDPAFGDGHCFSLRQDKDKHPGQIGLAFEPARDRTGIVDVSGVMWLDVASPALRTLEFRYTNVERGVADAEAGGFISFRTATNGLTVIDRWNLHLPSVEGTSEPPRASSAPNCQLGCVGETRWRVIDIHDVGAVIATAVWPDGSQWHSPLGTLRGRAMRPASDGASPVRDALVWLTGTDDSTRTAADGSFELRLLLPGPYPLFAAESPAVRFVFQQNDSLRIDVDSIEMPPIRLAVPRLAERIKTFCQGATVAGMGRTLMLGRVLLPDGSNASGATVEGFWGESQTDPGHGFHVRARTDTSGAFHVCGLAAGDVVRASATLDSLDANDEGLFRAHADSILFQATLRLIVPPFRSRIARVVDERGDPIVHASLLDEDHVEVRATTDLDGVASLSWLPRGRTTVRVLRAGYEPASTTVSVDPKDTTVVTVALRRAP